VDVDVENENVTSINIMSLFSRIEHGDSGGPVVFFDGRTGLESVVGVTATSVDDNTSYASRLTSQALTLLSEATDEFERRSQGHAFPVPTEHLPNGRPNPAYHSYPLFDQAAGPATRTQDYFDNMFPTPSATPFPRFDDPGDCG
jgi:hypothetical protein